MRMGIGDVMGEDGCRGYSDGCRGCDGCRCDVMGEDGMSILCAYVSHHYTPSLHVCLSVYERNLGNGLMCVWVSL